MKVVVCVVLLVCLIALVQFWRGAVLAESARPAIHPPAAPQAAPTRPPAELPAHIAPPAPAASLAPAWAPPVGTRKDALEFFEFVLRQIGPPPETIPELDFQPERTASAEEKAQIAEARRTAEEKGILLIVARLPDGTLLFDESRGDFPTRTFVPPHLREHLTDQDHEDFQVRLKTLQFIRGVAGRKSRAPSRDTTAPVPPPESRQP